LNKDAKPNDTKKSALLSFGDNNNNWILLLAAPDKSSNSLPSSASAPALVLAGATLGAGLKSIEEHGGRDTEQSVTPLQPNNFSSLTKPNSWGF
jgi:hypothetical protein